MATNSQYAIIKTGSKQYRVQAGDVIDVELLQPLENGQIEFNDVLVYHDGNQLKMGASNMRVRAEVLSEVRGPKVIAFKYKRRKNYRRKIGHRQNYTRVRITEFAV
jgi:large subunit ribosomal protein L21